MAQPTPDVSHRIGILAGHWGYDSGAICPDGLREVDITTDIARRVAERLKILGYQVDLLQEQDPDKPEPPLQDYLAAAFVSLHVDSCVPGASGFKVSRWRFSQMPTIEDRFVSCLYEEYSAATGLVHQDDSITIDMWNYYAFREIGKPTPGAIIEMGFMSGDRWLLVQEPDVAAQGIVNGIRCFLEGKTGN
ncbi:MAG: N-acetylmuramoyl-L-alanine amidase [Chloroflexi bacterium]|nr:MAG: N-acetylmuramoyl-L-alanine amidase [Chloroflexota bacterium]